MYQFGILARKSEVDGDEFPRPYRDEAEAEAEAHYQLMIEREEKYKEAGVRGKKWCRNNAPYLDPSRLGDAELWGDKKKERPESKADKKAWSRGARTREIQMDESYSEADYDDGRSLD